MLSNRKERYYVADVDGYNNHILTYAANKTLAKDSVKFDLFGNYQDKTKITIYTLADFMARQNASEQLTGKR